MNLDLNDDILTPGNYVGRLVEVHTFTAKSGWYCIRWTFEIDHEGREWWAQAYTSTKPTARRQLAGFLKGMGLPSAGKVDFDEDELLGRTYQVRVVNSDAEGQWKNIVVEAKTQGGETE